MEGALIEHVNEVANSPGVKGVLVIDKQGLCIAANGVLSEKHAGSISSFARTASSLEESGNPLMSIKYEKKDLLIYQSAGVTLAVLKEKEL
ncbi:ragulator complex protein LAMTOR5 homolog [Artemia franciscana]